MKDEDLLRELRIEHDEREGAGPGRWRWFAFVVALLVVGGAGGWWALQGRVLVVDTAAAEPPAAASAAVLEATGYVTARREATVSAKITGRLSEVLIEEGDRVREGQVLARLDDTDANARLELARSQVAAARAQLGQLQAQLAQSQRDFKRQQELRGRGLIAAQALENARTQLDSYRAQLDAQQSEIRVAEAQLRLAQVDYANTVIRAPFSGVVVNKAAQPGEIVSPMSAGGGFTRTGICTVVDMDSLEIEVDVNEAYINRVKPEQPVQAVLDAYPSWKIPAHVIAIIPTADRSKATVKVRIALEEQDPRILPDMGVRVSFLEATAQDRAPATRGVLVPATAVVEREGRSVVFVITGDRARMRTVSPAQSYGDLRLIENGVEAGERVVRDPPADLADGTRVQPRAASG